MIKQQVLGRTNRLLPFNTKRTAYEKEIGGTQTITGNGPLPSNIGRRDTQTASDLINFLTKIGKEGGRQRDDIVSLSFSFSK
jgi:hypothetical protein